MRDLFSPFPQKNYFMSHLIGWASHQSECHPDSDVASATDSHISYTPYNQKFSDTIFKLG